MTSPMGAGRHISRPDVLRLAEALGIRWNGLDTMPVLFARCIERARRLERQADKAAEQAREHLAAAKDRA